jgi:DNA-binding NarL/FixJ family response regulator
MIQEDRNERVCIAVVLGTADEAAAFVRRLEAGHRPAVMVRHAQSTANAGVDALVVANPSMPPGAVASTPDVFDRAVVWLRRRGRLTTSECVVLALRARGFSNGAIARVLGIEAGTVKCHVNNAMRRLDGGAGSRPARVIAQALDAVRCGDPQPEPEDDEWIRITGIARARLEPRVDDPRAVRGGT